MWIQIARLLQLGIANIDSPYKLRYNTKYTVDSDLECIKAFEKCQQC